MSLDRSQARSRLATIASVVTRSARPNLTLGVYALGIGESGSEIAYTHVPNSVPRPMLPPRPKIPGSLASNPLRKSLFEKKELAPWQREVDAKLAEWRVAQVAAARAWVQGRTAGIVNSTTRSPREPATDDLSVGLFRAGRFFSHTNAIRRVLVVLTDRMPPPPAARGVDYGLAGVRVILVGWKTDRPAEFQQRVATWSAFFISHSAQPQPVLARGIDSSPNVVAAITRQFGAS